MKSYGCGETLLSLVDPDNATTLIIPALPLQDVGHLALTAWQHARHTSRHGSGFMGGGPYCPYFQNGVTESWRLINISKSILFRRWVLSCSCLNNTPGVRLLLNILLFIQFIFYMFYDCFFLICSYLWYTLFIWYHFCSLDYSYFCYIFIVVVSYSRLYFSFDILFFIITLFFCSRVLLYIFCLSLISMFKYKYFWKYITIDLQ